MRRIRIALTGTLGLLGNRLARRLEGDESCQRVVLLDLAPPPAESRARAELGFAVRHSTRDTLLEFARTRLRDAA